MRSSIADNLRTLVEDSYDVAFSLNGGDLDTVETAQGLASHLQRHGLKVFFYRDPQELQQMLGHDLAGRLKQIYAEKARQIVLIASPGYGLEGFTELEWEAIEGRRAQAPKGASFLVPVSTVEPEQLPPAISGLAFFPSHEGPRPVVDAVIRRLGRWPLVKAAIYYLLLFTAVLSLLVHWWRRYYVDPLATFLTLLALGMGLAWWLAFRLIPRIRPSIVYAPSGIGSRLYQRLYLNLVAERLFFATALFTAGLAHLALPSLEFEIKAAMADWLGDRPEERNSALRFFKSRFEGEASFRIWTAVAVDEQSYGRAERGKALDMISRLLSREELQQPVRKEIAGRLRDLGTRGELGLNLSNWPSSLGGIDASGVDLDYANLARLHFAGRDSIFKGTQLKQADISGSYFQAADFDGADVRWSDFSLASFLGIRGKVSFGGAYMPGTTFFGCPLTDSSFYGSDLTGAKFMSCTLDGVDFTNAFLAGVSFEDCDLTGAKFTVTDVRRIGRWGDLAGVTFLRCKLGGVEFREADFQPKSLTFYRITTPDPSNLNRDAIAYTRDPELAKGTEGALSATVSIPATVFVECTFCNDEHATAGENASGCDFSGVRSLGLLMDRATYAGLSPGAQEQLKDGGFKPEDMLAEIPGETEPPRRFPALADKSWESMKKTLLNPLFDAATRSIPPHRLK